MDQLVDKEVKIRKPHKCWGCGETYSVGTIMDFSKQADSRIILSSYWCKTCCTVLSKLEYWQREDGFAFAELKDEYGDMYKEGNKELSE